MPSGIRTSQVSKRSLRKLEHSLKWAQLVSSLPPTLALFCYLGSRAVPSWANHSLHATLLTSGCRPDAPMKELCPTVTSFGDGISHFPGGAWAHGLGGACGFALRAISWLLDPRLQVGPSLLWSVFPHLLISDTF